MEIGIWAGIGALVGASGAVLVARMPRGVDVSRVWCALAVAVLWSATSGVGPSSWWWPVPLALGWLAVLLSATDLRARRLPDALTLPAYPIVAGLLIVAAAGTGDPGLLVRGGLGALVWAGCYALIRLVAPGALGGGDVKLAGPLGAVTAATSWLGLLLAMVVASLVTVVAAAAARILGHRDVAHGPAMLAASWLVVLCRTLRDV